MLPEITLAIALLGALTAIGAVISQRQQSKQAIRSSEVIAERDARRKDTGELRLEQAAIKLELERCNEDRAADALQRASDATRHAADEDQRRKDDERHRADEQRHMVDVAEIAAARQEVTVVRRDLTEIQRKLRAMADAAKIFGEETATAGQEIEENASHP